MKIQYLLTTIKKSNCEINDIIKKLNLTGEILVGNQMMQIDEEYTMNIDKCFVRVFNQTAKGVSKNRNFLLKHSDADYITFLDDDMRFFTGSQQIIEGSLEKLNMDCVRFNVLSMNPERPFPFIKKAKFLKFRDLTSLGVCGCFYRRKCLIENQILFLEHIGPGMYINHGEDTIFHRMFLKKAKIFSLPELSFCASQKESTWHGDSRNIEQELISHGYVYHYLYGKLAFIMSILFLLSHLKYYPKTNCLFKYLKYMKTGIIEAKEFTNESSNFRSCC